MGSPSQTGIAGNLVVLGFVGTWVAAATVFGTLVRVNNLGKATVRTALSPFTR